MSKADPPAQLIFTAVVCPNGGVFEDNDDVQSMITQPLIDEEMEIVDLDDGTVESSVPPRNRSVLPARAIGLGILTGFFTHALALAAYAYKVMYYGTTQQPSAKFTTEWFTSTGLFMLSHIDILVYVCIWLAFGSTLSTCGIRVIQQHIGERVDGRTIFILGVYYLVGIIMGAFSAWTIVDFFLGFTVNLVPMACSVIVDFILCYTMVCCFDASAQKGGDEDDYSEEGMC